MRAILIIVLLATVGCASPAQNPGRSAAGPDSGIRSAGPVRITAAIRGEARNLTAIAPLPGGHELRELMQSGLAMQDDTGAMRAQLGEAVPALENGLWVVFPDGTMETTWRIREGVRWHDSAPLTGDDLLFTVQASRDPEIAVLGHVGFAFLDGITLRDERTAVVRWKQPYVLADTLFSSLFAPPLPRHLLLTAYSEDRSTFQDAPYWTEAFVSTGPFKLREWVRGSHMELIAHDSYLLGRPKVDQIRVAFIPDPNVLVASVLSDAVDVTLGRSLSLDQAIQVRQQWRNGSIEINFVGRIAFVPQFLNAVPPVMTNVQFRRAMLHAIDREAMADVLQDGLSAVAESYLNPNQIEYRDIDASVPKYPYDVRLALQLLDGLGYVRSPDGLLRDGAGQRLAVEGRTSQGDDIQEKALLSTADYWQRIGVTPEVVIVPQQRQQDREYRANHPGFEFYRQPDDVPQLGDLHGSQTPLPENNYAGRNRSRYMNPEFDALLDRYFVTIPRAERNLVLGQIVHHISDQLTILGLFYNSNPAVVSNRLKNASTLQRARVTWNAHEWAVTP